MAVSAADSTCAFTLKLSCPAPWAQILAAVQFLVISNPCLSFSICMW